MKKIYFYEVGYWSYEESPVNILTNEKYFTQEQFNELVSDCALKVYDSKNNEQLNSIREHNDKADDELDKLEVTFDTIRFGIIEMLILEFGFKELEISASFVPFGWASIEIKDWKEVKDPYLEILRRKIMNK